MWTQEKINETYLQVQGLAASDEVFREEMLKNPNAAIEKVAGISLPANAKIKVIESDPEYTATFVLPTMEHELSENDLEDVAGGCIIVLRVTKKGK